MLTNRLFLCGTVFGWKGTLGATFIELVGVVPVRVYSDQVLIDARLIIGIQITPAMAHKTATRSRVLR